MLQTLPMIKKYARYWAPRTFSLVRMVFYKVRVRVGVRNEGR